jgi:YdjC-like protein
VHSTEPVLSALLAAGERLGVPIRAQTPGISYCGVFYGQDGRGVPVPEAIEVDALVLAIEALPSGVTELACHPAAEADHESTYDQERLTELETLCHERVHDAIERCRIELRSFADLEPARDTPDRRAAD